jgi:hypothetical protein
MRFRGLLYRADEFAGGLRSWGSKAGRRLRSRRSGAARGLRDRGEWRWRFRGGRGDRNCWCGSSLGQLDDVDSDGRYILGQRDVRERGLDQLGDELRLVDARLGAGIRTYS